MDNKYCHKISSYKKKLKPASACNFIKKETLAQMFSCEFCEISKNTFFTEHFWTTASMGSYNFRDSDTESKGSYSSDDVWGDDSDTSDESNEEQEIFYDENPYCIVSRTAMQKMINERASCKYCNGSLTIIDDDNLSQSLDRAW